MSSAFQSDESELKKLDSSIKKNNAVLNKLRRLTEDTKVSTLNDLNKVNLSKYVSEAVAALLDAKIR